MELRWERRNGRDGHTVGRELLAEMTGQNNVMSTETGKPYFPEGPHFSISHTEHHVFVCVSHRNVGIDAEEADRVIRPAAYAMLSASERSRIQSDRDFLRIWVQKEAYAKLTGRGIGNYLKNTDFNPDSEKIMEIDGCFVAVLED